jgi:hypothetical protein
VSRIDELNEQILALTRERNAITDAEDDALDAAFVGRCFRVRDNYSCPEKASDYWWTYIKVLRHKDGLACLNFYEDSLGQIAIRANHYYVRKTLEGYEEITAQELGSAFNRLLGRASALLR